MRRAPVSAMPGKRGDERAEGVAAHLEVGELVEGGAGGRQQHDGLGARRSRPRRARPPRPRASSVPQRSKATLPSSVAANSSVASPIR